jgi:hypothetical protein
MNNIDFFNRFSLRVLQELYDEFPRPHGFEADILAMEVVPDDADHDTTFACLAICGDVVRFLQDEGFITTQSSLMNGTTFIGARLTMKGLLTRQLNTDCTIISTWISKTPVH